MIFMKSLIQSIMLFYEKNHVVAAAIAAEFSQRGVALGSPLSEFVGVPIIWHL